MRKTNQPSPRSEVKSVAVCRHVETVETDDQQTDVHHERREIHKNAVLERRKERDDLKERTEITIGQRGMTEITTVEAHQDVEGESAVHRFGVEETEKKEEVTDSSKVAVKRN
jgi:hypothetical protein